MEKEVFFAAAALALGPPPATDRRGTRFSTLVGDKGHIESKSYREYVAERKYASRLLSFYIEMHGTSAAAYDVSYCYEEYVKWYRLQNKLRTAAEKI